MKHRVSFWLGDVGKKVLRKCRGAFPEGNITPLGRMSSASSGD